MPKDYNDYTAEDWAAQVKADSFDAQYEASKSAGDAKEASGQYRPEPNGKAN